MLKRSALMKVQKMRWTRIADYGKMMRMQAIPLKSD
jgi:hypothetical protein